MTDRVEVTVKMEDGLVFITLFPGRIIIRLYIMRVLLVMTMMTVERAEVVHMSDEI